MKNNHNLKYYDYYKGQHDLICRALKVPVDPNAPGLTAYEGVCELLNRIHLAQNAKTLKETKQILRNDSCEDGVIPLYS